MEYEIIVECLTLFCALGLFELNRRINTLRTLLQYREPVFDFDPYRYKSITVGDVTQRVWIDLEQWRVEVVQADQPKVTA